MTYAETPTGAFVKFHGAAASQDWKRVVALHDASVRTVAFDSPRPLHCDPLQGTISYEQLPLGRPLAELLGASLGSRAYVGDKLEGLLGRVGEALAAYQSSAGMPEVIDLDLDGTSLARRGKSGEVEEGDLVSRLPVVPMHGDFGATNVWITDDERIYFIDPIPSRFCPDRTATRASFLYDLGHMVSYLWMVYPPQKHVRAIWSRADRWVSSFLSGFAEARGGEVPEADVLGVAHAIGGAYSEFHLDHQAASRGIPRWVWVMYLRRYYRWRQSALLRRREKVRL